MKSKMFGNVKRGLGLLVVLMFFAACAGTGVNLQVNDDNNTLAIAYAAGKAMGFGINKLVPEVDPDLTSAWSDMMKANIDNPMVSTDAMLMFYNQCLGAIALHTSDPYGLMGDLGIFLMIYGAQFDVDGNMIGIQPVPYKVLKYFELGYVGGRNVASVRK